ncbi:MAG: helicase HerA-like domain-containing protein [Thermoproteota archaeon]
MRVCIDLTDQVYPKANKIYEMLKLLDAWYTFSCRHGRCKSMITIERKYVDALSSIPGIKLVRCNEIERAKLLPPPQSVGQQGRFSAVASSSFVLGKSGRARVLLPIDLVWRHVAIVGATGSGKTNTAARLASCISLLGIPVAVLDWNGEYPMLLSSRGVTERVRVFSESSLPQVAMVYRHVPLEMSLGLAERVLELSQFQSAILSTILASIISDDEGSLGLLKALLGSRTATGSKGLLSIIEDVLERVRRENTVRALAWGLATIYSELRDSLYIPRGEAEVWHGLIRRLNSLAYSRQWRLFRVVGEPPISYIQDGINVFMLSSVEGARVRRGYALFLLQALYSALLAKLHKGMAVLVDEAHNVLDSSLLDMLLAEARKHKLGLILVTTSASVFSQQALSNINTLLLHRITNPQDLKLLGVEKPEFRDLLIGLDTGVAGLRAPGYRDLIVTEITHSEPCTEASLEGE